MRRTNLLNLFAKFVAEQLAEDPSANIAGMDRAFASRVQINNTYFSGLKSGSRQMGNTLARQIEFNLGVAREWLDTEHDSSQERGLQRFLETARKTYLKADETERKRLLDVIRASRTDSSK